MTTIKKIVRKCVFETNSSTSHSIIIFSKEDEKRWRNDASLYIAKDIWEYFWKDAPIKPKKGKLYTREELFEMLRLNGDIFNPDEWGYSEEEYDSKEEAYNDKVNKFLREEGFVNVDGWNNLELEESTEEFVSPSGDEMIALCAYGYE